MTKLIDLMISRFGSTPPALNAGIGPSAGPENYEVKDDVYRAAAGLPERERFFIKRDGRMYFDLWSANRAQLELAGIPADQIELAGICTMSRTDIFYSYRREGTGCGHFLPDGRSGVNRASQQQNYVCSKTCRAGCVMFQCTRNFKEALPMSVLFSHNRVCRVLMAGLSLLTLVGCGGGEFGSELAMRPSPRPLSAEDGATLRLPQDQSFSITLAPKQSAPGLEGKANAVANAESNGQADALALVENGGSATAGFQLGHAVRNDTDRMINLEVAVRCEFETNAEATPPSPLPDATVGLHLYVRDKRNRLLRNFSLAQHSTEEGAAASTDRKDIIFALPLGPRESVSIFLAGSVQVELPEQHAARGSIKLSKLEMEIKTAAVPPVRKAVDE